jgi:hypothetical protein
MKKKWLVIAYILIALMVLIIGALAVLLILEIQRCIIS